LPLAPAGTGTVAFHSVHAQAFPKGCALPSPSSAVCHVWPPAPHTQAEKRTDKNNTTKGQYKGLMLFLITKPKQ
jgi:hypothetical protein